MIQPQAEDPGVHASFIKSRIPLWVNHAHPVAIKTLHRSQAPRDEPAGFSAASPELRQALRDSWLRSEASRRASAQALAGLKNITEFVEPLLVQALRTTYGLTLDVNAHEFVHLREDASWRIDKLSEVLISRQSLLQAALQNFEAEEARALRTNTYSALTPTGALAPFPRTVDLERRASDSIRYASRLSITPEQFALFCRNLNLGQQYQDHLAWIFDSPARSPILRQALMRATRDAMEVQVHTARMKAHISEATYIKLMALFGGSPSASETGAVRCSQLQLLLWKPTLEGYESDCDLPKDLVPNTRGQYEHRGRYFVRLNGRRFEQVLDERIGQWVIKAKDSAAYSPKLSSTSA